MARSLSFKTGTFGRPKHKDPGAPCAAWESQKKNGPIGLIFCGNEIRKSGNSGCTMLCSGRTEAGTAGAMCWTTSASNGGNRGDFSMKESGVGVMGRSKRTEEVRKAFLASARENVVPDMGLFLQYTQGVITDIAECFQPLTLVEHSMRGQFPEAAACADDMAKFTTIACVEKRTKEEE